MASNHFDDSGNVRMVDVSCKAVTKRVATAVSEIRMSPPAAQAVRRQDSRKGDVLAVARLAAISATKWTSHLIPLCHAIPIESVDVAFDWAENAGPESSEPCLTCRVTCQTSGKTGIEMEAMTGASVAMLTVYDMLKSVDRQMAIGPTALQHKQGGQSGTWTRPDQDALAKE